MNEDLQVRTEPGVKVKNKGCLMVYSLPIAVLPMDCAPIPCISDQHEGKLQGCQSYREPYAAGFAAGAGDTPGFPPADVQVLHFPFPTFFAGEHCQAPGG